MKEFTNVAREVARKRNRFIPIKIVPAHAKLQERTRYLRVWSTEFDRVDDGDTRRDVPLRDLTNKRRGCSGFLGGHIQISESGELSLAVDEDKKARAVLRSHEVNLI